MADVSLKVPSDVAGYAAGSMLSDVAAIATYWRTAYAEANEGASLEHMDDEQIVSLASDVEPAMKGENYNDADEYMLEVFTALEEAGEPSDEVEIADDIRAVAMKVGQSKVIAEWIGKVIAGQKDVDAGPAFIAKEILTLAKQELAVISWPGSETGNNPDITKGTRHDAGTIKKYTHSKVKDFISLQPRVSVLLEEIKAAASTAEGQKQTQEQMTRVKNLNTSVTAATRAYTFAIKAALMMAHLEEHPLITMEWREEDGDISKWKYCIDVGNRLKPKEYGAFTIAGITKIAPSMIPSTMGYTSLIEALKRKKKPETGTTKYPVPNGVKDMDDILSTTVHAFQTPSLWSQTTVALAYTEGENKELGDDIIQNLGWLEEYCATLLKQPKARSRLVALRRAKAAAGKIAPVETDDDSAEVAA